MVDSGVNLLANAYASGNGGNVIVWSETATKMYGSISALGGAAGGNGGFVETSSKGFLDVTDATVNLSAAHGTTGTWLLDPENVTIVSTATSGGSFDGGATTNTFTPTSASSTILNSTIDADLVNANVLITTGSTGTQTGDITVSAPISWLNSNSLTLSAFHSIYVNSTITNTGGGNLVLQSDNTGTGSGTVSFSGTAPQLNITGGGVANIYYNPTTFGTPTNYSSNASAGTTLTAYMLINNLTNLQAVNNNLSGNYALGTNIDATATSSWNGGAGFIPLGNSVTPYSGQFDGQGYQVANLTINAPAAVNVGLFGYTSSSSTIANLSVSGTVTGLSYVGVLVGNNSAYLSNVSSSGTISTGANALDVGGLIGINNNAAYNANSSANVTAGSTSMDVGGLVGYNQAYLIDVYSTGTVTAGSGSTNIGGLIGINYRPVLTSYSSSVVNSPDATNIGGLIGNNYANLENVYASAGITAAGSTNVGGLIGLNDAYITYTYSTTPISASGSTNIGGLIGNNQGTILDSYWNTDTSGLSTAVGTGSSTGAKGGCFSSTCTNGGTVNLSNIGTFDWDFSATWGIIQGESYPYLLAFNPLPPTVISGNLPPTSGTLATLADDGSVVGTVQSGANGSFYFFEPSGTISAGDDLLVYTSGTSLTGNVVAVATGSSMSDLTI